MKPDIRPDTGYEKGQLFDTTLIYIHSYSLLSPYFLTPPRLYVKGFMKLRKYQNKSLADEIIHLNSPIMRAQIDSFTKKELH